MESNYWSQFGHGRYSRRRVLVGGAAAAGAAALLAAGCGDDDSGSTTGSASLTVNNVAPVLDTVLITSPINENGTATLSGTYHDVGSLDTHTIDIDFLRPDAAPIRKTIQLSRPSRDPLNLFNLLRCATEKLETDPQVQRIYLGIKDEAAASG